ncbi:hypothetical protein B1987_26825 [Mycobacterium kansasii]|uniref:DUF3556 domain-containing protein n=1 Tax=Mycobacterium attenuatum TaxID=2341086 RepID=A0A498Q1E1_9MYCO|nr:DUF3556 domain-containing protein [Mycobacterium attenuatum]ORB86776.1 hypothetical protein B1987_26825 [Mycobacterium kansasii]VBA38135.1 hypothetical protein LAUMK136_02290 [Mycobacterium attenuatum]VBA57276.1 hypothetical protein LAUMK41_02377 [Mycobacterium attenuatum]
MGFMSPELPDVDPATWQSLPRATRLQIVTRHWVDHGFGTPYAAYLLYLVKIGVYVAAPAAIISLTPGLGGLGHIADWWTQPIVYQKVIIFTLLFEVMGFGCGSGPLTGRFMPPVGGFLYWLRPKTIRLPAWPDKVPLTRGDSRTVVDVALYAVVLAGGVWALLSPGEGGPVTAAGDVGLVNPVLVVPMIVALAVLGLRDKTIFLAARGEHYWLKLLVFFFPFTDQIAAFKLIMLALWWGAATSKLNHHFPYVVSVMTSNNALLRSKLFNPLKRLLYLDPVNDLRPSWLPKLMAHVGGTTAEFLVPGVLVFVADGHPWRWFLIGFMVIFHLNILSNLPMGVPLEWNVFFIFSLFYLFGHYGTIGATDLRSPLLLAIVLAAVAVAIAGNLLPEKISFLPSMRYYAGNWATSIWCFRPGAEDKLEANVVKSSALVVNQLARLYGADSAEIMMDKTAAFRAMHTHGRALNGLVPRAVGGPVDETDYSVREGELIAGPLVGWNFGEGHLHNEQLLAAVQRRCNFAEGEVRVVILEGQPIHVQKQWYRIVDAKAGVLEAGYAEVKDMLTRQPWPEPGDEFPVHVTTERTIP